jgi:hypothetical protein
VLPDWYVDPKLAAASYSGYEAVIQADGVTHIVPYDYIDPSKVELACNLDGVVLIPDDGNSYNDLHVDYNNPNIHYHNGVAHDMGYHTDDKTIGPYGA